MLIIITIIIIIIIINHLNSCFCLLHVVEINRNRQHKFCKVIRPFSKSFVVPVTFFPATSQKSSTFASLVIVFRAHYAICKHMFTAEFQYNFRQIETSFLAGSHYQLVVSDMLLFWCSWFQSRDNEVDHGQPFVHYASIFQSILVRKKHRALFEHFSDISQKIIFFPQNIEIKIILYESMKTKLNFFT